MREHSHSLPVVGAFGSLPSSSIPEEAVPHAVGDVVWNADGSLLAVHLVRRVASSEHHVLQLWSSTNHCWTLRQELGVAAGQRLRHFAWHAEDALSLHLLTERCITSYTFTHAQIVSDADIPHDAACTAVIDGSVVRLTPLRTRNVPPPYAAYTLCIDDVGQTKQTPLRQRCSTIRHVAWRDDSTTDESRSILALLVTASTSTRVLLYACDWGNLATSAPKGGWPLRAPRFLGAISLSAPDTASDGASRVMARQVALSNISSDEKGRAFRIAVLCTDHTGASDALIFTDVEVLVGSEVLGGSLKQVKRSEVRLGKSMPRTLVSSSVLGTCDSGVFCVHDADGFVTGESAASAWFVDRRAYSTLTLHRNSLPGTGSGLPDSRDQDPPVELARLPEWCPSIAHRLLLRAQLTSESSSQKHEALHLTFGLSKTGKLYANETCVASDATSFVLSGDMLVWSTTAHRLKFLSVSSCAAPTDTAAGNLGGDAGRTIEDAAMSRRVERSSRIVAAIPSSMSLVLQMPRGNLETIYPRPLVLSVVRRHLAR